MKKLHCAIYTRKSTEEGLEQDFNSLDAQYEACKSYILSQKHEGWKLNNKRYDDGGVSGGTMERSGLLDLLSDIDTGLVDMIVVYKIDRLTRSLADFVKIVERLDVSKASFVSVTQSFNTASSMGRLTLNMLLSFAQFEREVTGERIRDKVAASKKKGLWMGGVLPLGYKSEDKKLIPNIKEAEIVKDLFKEYLNLKSLSALSKYADNKSYRTRRKVTQSGKISGDNPIAISNLYRMLTNPIYIGKIKHKENTYEGRHEAIIEEVLWNKVQAQLIASSAKSRGSMGVNNNPLALKGKIFDHNSNLLTPSHANKKGKRYYYYVSNHLIRKPNNLDDKVLNNINWRLSAKSFEKVINIILLKWLEHISATDILCQSTITQHIEELQNRKKIICSNKPNLLNLVEKIILEENHIMIRLHINKFAEFLHIDQELLNPDCLLIQKQFSYKKRGVEQRFIIDNNHGIKDKTLLRNIAKAHYFYNQVKKGKSFKELEEKCGISKRQIQKLTNLAFLSPKIINNITKGNQPLSFTSDWLINNPISSSWDEQDKLAAKMM